MQHKAQHLRLYNKMAMLNHRKAVEKRLPQTKQWLARLQKWRRRRKHLCQLWLKWRSPGRVEEDLFLPMCSLRARPALLFHNLNHPPKQPLPYPLTPPTTKYPASLFQIIPPQSQSTGNIKAKQGGVKRQSF